MDINLILKSFHPQLFAGKVYGVTGAGHGIGEATARGICALGGRVIALDIDQRNLRRVRDDIGPAGIEVVVGDVTDPATLDDALRRIEALGGRLDGWVNNAMINPIQSLADQPEEKFVRAFEVNMLAAWRICKAVVPLIEKHSEGGSIVNVSSIMATLTAAGNAAYCATKAGLEGLTRALAIELAPRRIRVNTIAPGMVLTRSGLNHLTGVDPARWTRADQLRNQYLMEVSDQFQPWPSPGMPQHLAGGILFLLSPASEYMTGGLLPMNGGAGAWLVPISEQRGVDAGPRIKPVLDELREISRGQSHENKPSED